MKRSKSVRSFIPFLLILFVLSGARCNRSPDADPSKASTPSKEKIEKFFLPKATLRVDRTYLIPAKKIELVGISSKGRLKKIYLLFSVKRDSLPKLRPPHFELNISGEKILKLNPIHPIYIEVAMKHAALETANQRYRKTGRFREVIKMKGSAGFPLVLDLENYRLKKWLVEVERRIRIIE